MEFAARRERGERSAFPYRDILEAVVAKDLRHRPDDLLKEGRCRHPFGRVHAQFETSLAGLDELEVQAKLLRVLETMEVLPVGATTPVPMKLRVLSATNEYVEAAVKDGRLGQDLLFRIDTVALRLPPLRARRDDIALLAAHFLESYARLYGVAAPDLTSEDIAALLAHDWPGNVRELRNAYERRVLGARRAGGSMAAAIRKDEAGEDVPDTLREAVAAFERELIGKAIRVHEGGKDAAAEALGIARRTLNEKIVKLGLDEDEMLRATGGLRISAVQVVAIPQFIPWHSRSTCAINAPSSERCHWEVHHEQIPEPDRDCGRHRRVWQRSHGDRMERFALGQAPGVYRACGKAG